jgi:hypothetical protein
MVEELTEPQTTAKADGKLVLFFYPEDGDDMILRNVRLLSKEYTALYHRRQILFITTAVRTTNPTWKK